MSLIFAVFPVFSHQACEAGRERSWSLPRIREGVDEFTSNLIPYAYRRARVMDCETVASLQTFHDFVLADLHASAAWRAYLREVSELADELMHPTTPAKAKTKTKSSKATIKWRRDQLRSYATHHRIEPEPRFLAPHLGVSIDVYHALIRGDTKYGPETKQAFLKRLSISAAEWDRQR